MRPSDLVAAAAALAFGGTLWWAERAPAPPEYFFGEWVRDNPECAGGRERLRLEKRRLAWSDAEGHAGRARIRFRSGNRFEGVLLDIEGLRTANPSPTECGVKEGLVAAVYLRPNEDGGWVFREDPDRPWRRASPAPEDR